MPRRQLQPRSLEREVYTALQEEILNGSFALGDALVEAQIAAELGVSKTPVREALIRLQRDGLVEITPYRGARVATPSIDDVREACEVRVWLETQIVRKIAEMPPLRLLEDLRQSIDDAERALTRGDRAAYIAAVRSFSDVLVEASGNRYAKDILGKLRNLLGVIANAARTSPGREARSIAEHRAIYEAILAGDPDGADEATRAHILSIENDSFQSIADLAGQEDGREG
jgi:GntR family transcriptional regulator, rspAB operon transcriptional repressor